MKPHSYTVSAEVIEERQKICRACPHIFTTDKGLEKCDLCTCNTLALVRSSFRRCPDSPPRWGFWVDPKDIVKEIPSAQAIKQVVFHQPLKKYQLRLAVKLEARQPLPPLVRGDIILHLDKAGHPCLSVYEGNTVLRQAGSGGITNAKEIHSTHWCKAIYRMRSI